MSDDRTVVSAGAPVPGEHGPPLIPDHEMLRRVGGGSYGEVWLARNVPTGSYRAVKIVRRAAFSSNRPFDREFAGLLKFEPISRSHEGFVDVLHVGRNDAEGYFFCIMELADDQTAGTHVEPKDYAPRMLSTDLARRSRLPVDECIQIGLGLTAALQHLHASGLLHRDIKPSNIIFVRGVPKLADVGLVAQRGEARSFVGTEGFIPPEGPGTPQADLYSLGKVLYESITGQDRQEFPELPADINEMPDKEKVLQLNGVILKACDNDARRRYQTAQQMHDDLLRLQQGRRVEFPEDPESAPTNLPEQLTSFVGRQKETTEVRALLDKTRLLTLTGIGGCGKTRLALEVGASLLDECPDGVWLVELAPLSDPALVPQAVATVMRVGEEPNRPLRETIAEHLSDQVALLLLDNCEHLIDACASLVDELLKSCPKLRILATSREGLGLAGEVTRSVPSLSAPDPKHLPPAEKLAQFESVQLLMQRAAAVNPNFKLTNDNAQAVAQICWRLDGIPLAIELAAARLRSLSAEQIAERLDDCFRLLTGGSRTALPRHQRLRAMLDWSHDLLSESERMLLRRLSVFAGGWSLEAAEEVCGDSGIETGDVMDLLGRLVDKSLVVAEEQGDAARYRMLETVRQYALDRLVTAAETEQVRARHFGFFLRLAKEAEPQLSGAEQQSWFERLDFEHDNLRAALGWSESLKQSAETELELAVALWWFWYVRSYFAEGRRWLEAALARNPDAPPLLRSEALNGAGALASAQGDYAAARASYEQSLAVRKTLGDNKGVAASLNNLGLVALEQSDYATARAAFEESLAIFEDLGENKQSVAGILSNLGMLARDTCEFVQARALLERSLALRHEAGDQLGVGLSLYIMGTVAHVQGDCADARALFEQALAIQQTLGDKRDAAWTLCGLGDVDCSQGDFARALSRYEQSLEIFRTVGETRGIGFALQGLGDLARLQHDAASVRRHYDESLRIFRGLNDKAGIAMVLCCLGQVAHDLGDNALALRHCRESLRLTMELRQRSGAPISLEALAKLASDLPLAVALFAAAAALRESVGTPLPMCERAAHDQRLAELRAKLGDAEFERAWTKGRAMTIEEAAAAALG